MRTVQEGALVCLPALEFATDTREMSCGPSVPITDYVLRPIGQLVEELLCVEASRHACALGRELVEEFSGIERFGMDRRGAESEGRSDKRDAADG